MRPEDTPAAPTANEPDSVMYTLSSFERRLVHGERKTDVQMPAGRVAWLAAQEHSGESD